MGGKRVDIKTGFLCNNNCLFCVQAHRKKRGNKPTELVKEHLRDARKRRDEVVFTGGEVTIREDLIELVSYAKELGYKVIQIQTNGRMLAYLKTCKAVVKAGANQFSPALHGPNAKIHDFLTKSKGSFEQTVKAIRNLRSLDQYVATNTVVVKQNYKHLPELARLFVKLGVNQFQFAFVHPMGNALVNYDEVVPKMSLVAPYMHKGLQIGIDAGKRVMAEAMPYCMMKGYEEYIAEKFIPDTEIMDAGYTITDYTKVRISEGKAKFPQCRKCKYDSVCEGPWREYPEKFGNKEFEAVR